MARRIVIGSRGSELALVQTYWVRDTLRRHHPGLEIDVEIITTKGDKITDVPLAMVGGKGLFTKELETALLEKRIDLAVHSLKDLPTELPAGLTLGAVTTRENPSDALISASGCDLDALPHGARVGTSSLRRQAQLRAQRPDIEVTDLRGNVPTRLKKLHELNLDAIVLASAGLRRLGLQAQITQELAPAIMLPAPGQGALGIEIRAGDAELAALLSPMHDPASAAATAAERAALRALGGGCQTPLGALAEIEGNTLKLRVCVCSADGREVLRADASGALDTAEQLGVQCASELLARGAGSLLGKAAVPGLAGKRVVVTRAVEGAGKLARELAQCGAEVFEFPAIRIVPRTSLALAREPGDYDWIVFTSANAVRSFAAAWQSGGRTLDAFRACAVCAIGPATAEAAYAVGLPVSLTPRESLASAIALSFNAIESGIVRKRFLLPRGNLANNELPDALRQQGAEVEEAVVYDTVPVEHADEEIASLLAFDAGFVLFTSGSAVEGFLGALNESQRVKFFLRAKAISIGPLTSAAARTRGLAVAVEAAQHDSEGILHALGMLTRMQ